MELVKEMLTGNASALARLITLVEEESTESHEIMKSIYPHLGKAYCIGITGAPGSGKSTLVDRLTALLRQEGFTVGVICVDPSSPFTGGALLGDRIRMQQHFLDEGVFVRSMGTRGSLGGLPQTIGGVIKLLDAFGKDFILVETVGVGQCEIDVMENVDAVVVVLVPGAGDAVQTMKAGLLEAADILAVNKGDYPGVHNLVVELQDVFHFQAKQDGWQVPVVVTEAINNKGIAELWQEVKKYRQFIEEDGRLSQRRREQRRHEFMQTLERTAVEELKKFIRQDSHLSGYLAKVEKGEIDPYSATEKVLKAGRFLQPS